MNERKMLEMMEQKALPEARANAEKFASLNQTMRDRHLNNLAPSAMQKLRDEINLVMKHDNQNYSPLIKQIDQKQIAAARLQVQADAAVEKMRQEREAKKIAAGNQPAEIKQTKADYAAFMVMRSDPKLQEQDKNMAKLMEGLAKDPERMKRLEDEITRRNPDSAKAQPILDSLQSAKDKFNLSAGGKDKINSEDLERSLTKSGLTRSG